MAEHGGGHTEKVARSRRRRTAPTAEPEPVWRESLAVVVHALAGHGGNAHVWASAEGLGGRQALENGK